MPYLFSLLQEEVFPLVQVLSTKLSLVLKLKHAEETAHFSIKHVLESMTPGQETVWTLRLGTKLEPYGRVDAG